MYKVYMGSHTNIKNDSQIILDSIRRIVRGLRVSSKIAEKELGISGAQLFVLQKLSQARRLSINELAERTLTHQSSVSVVVSRLVEQGLVARSFSPTDARRSELELTAEGRAQLKKIPPTTQENLMEAIEGMKATERKKLSDMLASVVTKAGLSTEPASLFFEDEKPNKKRKQRS
jgi:DNA-binding MarR family transcriptional regulator